MSDSIPNDEEGFDVEWPSFVLLAKDNETPLSAETTDGRKSITLFTDRDSAQTFIDRVKAECEIEVLSNGDDLRQFFSCFDAEDLVLIDPVGLDKQATAYTVRQVLESIDME